MAGVPPAFPWKMPRQSRVPANRAFSSEVDTGSREENASNKEVEPPFRFYWNGKGSSPALPANQPFGEFLFRLCVGVQDVLDRTSQIKQPLLDENRHIADV